MRRLAHGVLSAAALAAAACGDATAPEEARFPIVEGLYTVDTRIVSNDCRFSVVDGVRIYVFFQERGGVLEFRPPSFQGDGQVVLNDFGIQGQLQPSGEFLLQGTYTIEGQGNAADLIVAFTMDGQFDADSLRGEERHLASFPGGSCEVTFSLAGQEI